MREPLGTPIDTAAAFTEYCSKVVSGTGPIALDAERASGYRYSQRAYLVQVRREGSGSALIDPTAFHDLGELAQAIGQAEWILHAATQDLPCLAEVGLRPSALFDTELAGRLLNLPRVGLAALVEHYLGMSLAKEHSAADWSARPLPTPWLEYAALDVEVLVELRNLIAADLDQAGKLEWARQDFEALLDFKPNAPREDPWRRTSGIHRARGRRTLALIRQLWQARDAIARERDIAPGRILPDAAIIEIARTAPHDAASIRQLSTMRGKEPRRFNDSWLAAVQTALSLTEAELPSASGRPQGPPPPRAWPERNPDAAHRLSLAKNLINQLAEVNQLPTENLLSPSVLRALAWSPPKSITAATLGDALIADGARQWQVDLVAGPLSAAFTSAALP